MKPVRVVDIVRRKTTAKSSGTKAGFGNVKNAAKSVLKSSGTKILFFIGFAVILAGAVFVVKIVTEMVPGPSASQLPSAGTNQAAVINVFQETATVQNVVASLSSDSTSTATRPDTLPEIKPGLLPAVKLLPFKPTSTSTAESNKKTVAKPSRPKPAITPTVITARSLINATTLSMSERHDGPYKTVFVTNAGTYGKITWGLGKTTLKIGKSIPSFSISFSCNPSPNTPIFGAFDQSPTFNVKTSYSCTVGLTPTSGADIRTQSKQFSFTTGAGQLVVTTPSSMDTVLKNDTNFGGFVFRNDDSEPITITGLDIDVSYKGLSVADSPMILRFENPVAKLPFENYHLENLATDPSVPYGHAGENIRIPLSFTIKGLDKRMLPVNVLGVRKLSIYGVDPTITVTLRGVTTNQNLNRIVLGAAKISWSCIVPLGAYDPYATTGPFATGQACRQ